MHYGRDDRAWKGPKWQRARIVDLEEHPDLNGRELWIELSEPVIRATTIVATHQPMHIRGYRTHLRLQEPLWIGCKAVELLARDENDFADDVELIPWQDFLAECRKEQEPHA
jgi:hypothetical protein